MYWLTIETILLLCAILVSYTASSVTISHSSSYLRHKLWLGLNPRTVAVVAAMQIVALLSYLVLVVRLDASPPARGRLVDAWWLHTLNLSVLLCQVVWPHAVTPFQNRPVLVNAVLASIPLWLAAICAFAIVHGTFEDVSTTNRVLSILFGFVVILVDGIGWTSRAIFKSVVTK